MDLKKKQNSNVWIQRNENVIAKGWWCRTKSARGGGAGGMVKIFFWYLTHFLIFNLRLFPI
jgi:hypothetical protein